MLQANGEVFLEVVEGRGVDFSLVSFLAALQLLWVCIFFLHLLLYDRSKIGFYFQGSRRDLLLLLFRQELIDIYIWVSTL